jgi:hypothetical protein
MGMVFLEKIFVSVITIINFVVTVIVSQLHDQSPQEVTSYSDIQEIFHIL